ncbi:MAG TPA: DUF2202 domain-containing protein [Anaerolineae bacterium]|nr:DUF2202 domain-containing protein [Anaerolineae bacterium]
MTKLTQILLAGAAALSLAFTSVAWTAPASAASADSNTASVIVAPPTPPALASPLSTDEIAGLLFMREEEKVARDVYLTFYETWGSQVFSNIARAEQTHMDAIKTLLDRYGIADPAAGNVIGTFSDLTLQTLYDDLAAQGQQSLAEALRVGALIEEVDIADLIEELVAVEHSDIQRVYGQLLRGSENHLRAFVSTLERQTGETYQPQMLDRATYDQIINAASGGGPGQAPGRGGRGRGNH